LLTTDYLTTLLAVATLIEAVGKHHFSIFDNLAELTAYIHKNTKLKPQHLYRKDDQQGYPPRETVNHYSVRGISSLKIETLGVRN
jgi:hypothetical protein